MSESVGYRPSEPVTGYSEMRATRMGCSMFHKCCEPLPSSSNGERWRDATKQLDADGPHFVALKTTWSYYSRSSCSKMGPLFLGSAMPGMKVDVCLREMGLRRRLREQTCSVACASSRHGIMEDGYLPVAVSALQPPTLKPLQGD